MSETTLHRGGRGETLAAQFLTGKGFKIVARNYRDPVTRGEIDLIARQGDCLIFVEVKAGYRHEFGPPETWVDARKQRRVMSAASRYLHEHDLYETTCRFDVVGVTFGQGSPQITHIENAFWSGF